MADKNNPEDEYFARIDREKNAALAATVAAENAVKAKAGRRALHSQCCGKCGGTLVPTAFRGVEIDLCGECGAVLLDPGELETLAGSDQTGVIGSLASLFSFKKK